MSRPEEQATATAHTGVAERANSSARDKLIPGKTAGFAVALLLIIAIAVGAWWLRGEDPAPSAGSGAQQAEPRKPPVAELTTGPHSDDALPLAQLNGAAESHPDIQLFNEVENLGYLDDDEVGAYVAADAADARFQGQRLPDGCTARILLTSASSVDAATTAAKTLAAEHIDSGARMMPGPLKRGHITALEAGGSGQIVAHYVAGNVIVRIDVRKPGGLAEARRCFDGVLAAQLAVLPANA